LIPGAQAFYGRIVPSCLHQGTKSWEEGMKTEEHWYVDFQFPKISQ
jgi:hypothetical protein